MLSQTTDDGIKTNYTKYTIDPRTRYKSIPTNSKSYFDSLAYQNIMRRYKALKSPFKRQVSFAGAARAFRVLGKKSTRAKETVLQKLGKIQNPFSRQNSEV